MRVIQHNGDPGLVVHVISRIDTWQLTEGFTLLRLYLQVDNIDGIGVIVLVEHGAFDVHDQGKPLPIGSMTECSV